MKKHFFFIFIFISSLSFGQGWYWAADGSNGDDTYGVAADNKGNGYITGSFLHNISFGSNNLTSLASDTYLVKYDSSGNIQWAKQSVQHSPASGNSIECTTDRTDNVYITGSFSDTLFFGSYSTMCGHNQSDIFLTKYDANGNVLWTTQSKTQASRFNNTAYSVATDKYNNVFITGVFADSVTFGAITLKSISALGNVFLVKYDSNGTLLWAKQSTALTSNGTAIAYSVTCNSYGEVYVAGNFTDSIRFGATVLNDKSTANFGDIFIAKYDANGNMLWVKQSKIPYSSLGSEGYSVTTDNSDNIYITGGFYDTLYFGTYRLTANNRLTAFLVKYDTNGNVRWAKKAYTNGCGYSLAKDNNNRIYLAGYSDSTMVFCNDTLRIHKFTDPSILLELDTAANVLCSSIIATGGDDNNGIACSPSGKYIYLGGDIEDSITLGNSFLSYSASTGELPFITRWQLCSKSDLGANKISGTQASITLFPNPNNGQFNIRISGKEQGVSKIEVYNMLGEKVYSTYLITKSPNYQIDLSSQPNGVYLYRVMDETGTLLGSGKFIIQK